MVLVFVFLYAPIILLIVFSFNAGNSNMVWKGFSLDWYAKLFRNRLIMQSVYTTLLVSLLAGIAIFPEEFGIKVLTLPVGGFLTLGCLIALMQWALAKSAKKKEAK